MNTYSLLDMNIPFTRFPDPERQPRQWVRRGLLMDYFPHRRGARPFVIAERNTGGAVIWVGGLRITVDAFTTPEPRLFTIGNPPAPPSPPTAAP